MSKARIRRLILVSITIVVAILYIVLNRDIVQVLDESTIHNNINEVTKNKSSSQTIDVVKPNKVVSGMFLGSTKEDVLDALGEPSKKEVEFLNQWYYEESVVYFDSEDLVVGYQNLGELDAALNAYVLENYEETNKLLFFIGSSQTDIIMLLGPPTYIDHLQPDVWKYKNSTIHFTSQKLVDGYMNYYGEIDEYLPKSMIEDNKFTIGSSKEEVITIMGAPTSIENYHPNIWIYKLAKVYFAEDGKVEHVEDGYGDLSFEK